MFRHRRRTSLALGSLFLAVLLASALFARSPAQPEKDAEDEFSITGLQGNPGLPDYSATKGAIHAFTKSLAKALVKKGIRVNVVAPGPVWTPLQVAEQGASPDKLAEFGTKTPMERPAQSEEIAPLYVFFASEADSIYITGEVVTLLGGETTTS